MYCPSITTKMSIPMAILLLLLVMNIENEIGRRPTVVVVVEAFSTPPSKTMSRSSCHLATRGREDSGGDNTNGSNGWFFRPPVFDQDAARQTSTAIEEGTKQQRRGTKVSTLTKPDKKKYVGITDKTSIKVSNRLSTTTSPPLSKGEDSSSSSQEESFIDFSNPQTIFGLALTVGLASVVGISVSLGLTMEDFILGGQKLLSDPSSFSEELINGVQSLGPTGVIYYALIYMIAEILAIPATPLTLSAGYLFGLQNGILTVLVGATGAACIGFWISRTFLRDYVESTLLAPPPDGSPNNLAKLDKAIGKEGLKLLILIRLSPIFPFSVTNYLYGASSIDFGSYLAGTLIGFIPTTTAYVYTGMVGQALTSGNGNDQPWYIYAGGFTVLLGLVKLVTDVATGVIATIEEED